MVIESVWVLEQADLKQEADRQGACSRKHQLPEIGSRAAHEARYPGNRAQKTPPSQGGWQVFPRSSSASTASTRPAESSAPMAKRPSSAGRTSRKSKSKSPLGTKQRRSKKRRPSSAASTRLRSSTPSTPRWVSFCSSRPGARASPGDPRAAAVLLGGQQDGVSVSLEAHPHMLRHACGYALANKGHAGDPGLARPSVDHQHRRLHRVGAEPVQGFGRVSRFPVLLGHDRVSFPPQSGRNPC
jgi:hypothetical protein